MAHAQVIAVDFSNEEKYEDHLRVVLKELNGSVNDSDDLTQCFVPFNVRDDPGTSYFISINHLSILKQLRDQKYANLCRTREGLEEMMVNGLLSLINLVDYNLTFILPPHPVDALFSVVETYVKNKPVERDSLEKRAGMRINLIGQDVYNKIQNE